MKVRVGGAWVNVPTPQRNSCDDKFDPNDIDDQNSVVQLVSSYSPSATQAVSALSLSNPTQTATPWILPAVIAISSGVFSGTSTATTKPATTTTGDKIYLNLTFSNTQLTAPTITGWVLESGLDTVGGSTGTAIYSRTADNTATDSPTVTTSAAGGWFMASVRGWTGVDVAVAKSTSTGSSALFPGITTVSSHDLVLDFVSVRASLVMTLVAGIGWRDFGTVNLVSASFGLATLPRVTAGVVAASTGWYSFGSAPSWMVYSVALKT